MGEFNFADNYRAAGLTIGADALRTRQEPFDKLRKVIEPQTVIDLVRLYFGLPLPKGTAWFRDAFGETDPSFSLIDNEREAAVLAAGLLEAAVADGKIYAALATLTTNAGGLRKPVVRPELINAMRVAIHDSSVKARQQTAVDAGKIRLPAKSKLAEELAALSQGPDLSQACKLLLQVSDESAEITKNLTNQVFSVVKPLTAQVLTLREEVEMLWWYVGGWSRLLERPFTELSVGITAIAAGIDMADMSRSDAGPAAAPAIFQRILTAAKKEEAENFAIKDVVEMFSEDQIDCLMLQVQLGDLPEMCPVLTAFAKKREIGAGTPWHASFAKVTGLNPELALAPLNLATQVYRERLLLRAMSRD